MDGEFGLCPMVQLGRLEECLGRDATGIEAGTPEGIAAIVVLPFVDAGDFKLVLAGTNGAGVAGRAGTDDDDVVLVRH